MKNLHNLQEGDHIAFGFSYNGGEPDCIIVDNIASIYDDKCLVHFMYGHHSLAEHVKKEDIIAIGDMSASDTIDGWGGRYNILKPDHPLLKKQ